MRTVLGFSLVLLTSVQIAQASVEVVDTSGVTNNVATEAELNAAITNITLCYYFERCWDCQ